MRGKEKFRLPEILFAAVLLCLLFSFFSYLKFAVSILKFPYTVDTGEDETLTQASSLSRGRTIYTDIHSYPFLISGYPPLFPLLISMPLKIKGPIIEAGRTISFIATIAITCFIFKIAKSYTGNAQIGIISALFFLSSIFVIYWSVLCRVDMVGILLSISGIYYITNFSHCRKNIYIAAALFLLSLYTKQSLVSAPLAACFCLVTSGEKKLAFMTTGLLTAFGLILFLSINLATQGQFILHILRYNRNVFSWSLLRYAFGIFLRGHPAILPLCIYWLLRKSLPPIVKAYFLLTLCFSASAGHGGSSINYFIELWASSSLLFAFVLYDLRTISDFKTWLRLPVVLTFGVCIVQIVTTIPKIPIGPDTADYLAGKRIESHFSSARGDVLSEYPSFAIYTNKEVLFQPSIGFIYLSGKGTWDESPIIQDIKNKKFSLILLTGTKALWSKEMVNAVGENYKLIDKVYMYRIWGREPPVLIFTPQK